MQWIGVLAGVGGNPSAFLPSKYTTLDYPDYQLNFIERTVPIEEQPIEMTADVSKIWLFKVSWQLNYTCIRSGKSSGLTYVCYF